jgi:hypothetical protein
VSKKEKVVQQSEPLVLMVCEVWCNLFSGFSGGYECRGDLFGWVGFTKFKLVD